MKRFLVIFLVALSSPAHAHHSDEAMAKQIVRAYFAAFERKDFDLFRTVTWEDGTPDGKSCKSGGRLCRRFGDLNPNYLGGTNIVYRSKFESFKARRTANAYEFDIAYLTRQYTDQTIPTGQWCKISATFLVTERGGQWRLLEIEAQRSRCHKP